MKAIKFMSVRLDRWRMRSLSFVSLLRTQAPAGDVNSSITSCDMDIDTLRSRWRQRRAFGPIRTWHVALLTALIGTILFYLPLVGSMDFVPWPSFMMIDDQRTLYFPSFIEGYRRFWHGGLLGVDFLTSDGASIFAYRPNLLPFYPPYLLAYLLTDCLDPQKGMKAYVTLYLAHQFFGMFFSVILARRYLLLPVGVAILMAAVFAMSYQTSFYQAFATFYFQILLIPIVICGLCWAAERRSILWAIWMSMVCFGYMMTNYGPTMIAGLFIALICTGIVFMVQRSRQNINFRATSSIYPVMSIAIAGLACLPFFVAQLSYKMELAPTADTLEQVAHAWSYTGYDLINILSQNITVNRPLTEGAAVWGGIPSALILLGLVIFLRKGAAGVHVRVAGLAAVSYFSIFLVSFGKSGLVASDAFFYGVPVLGKMHIFQRYVGLAQILFALLVAISCMVFVQNANQFQKMIAAYAGIILWVVVSILGIALRPLSPSVQIDPLMIEAFYIALVGITIAVAGPKTTYTVVAVLCSIIGVTADYITPLTFNNPAVRDREVVPDSEEMKAVSNFMETHSHGAALSKLFIADPEVISYLGHNISWSISRRVKVVTIQGYPMHLSVMRSFAEQFPIYGSLDYEWLCDEGLSFVSWNEKRPSIYNDLVRRGVVVQSVLDLPNGNKLAEVGFDPAKAAISDQLLSLGTSDQKMWPQPLQMQGWQEQNGRLLKLGTEAGSFGFSVSQHPGRTYLIEFDVSIAEPGVLSVAFGSKVIRNSVLQEDQHVREIVTPSSVGDLWISGGPEFKGTVSNLHVISMKKHMPSVFDNGMIKIEADNPVKAVSKSNYTTKIDVETEAEHPSTLIYTLWPNPYLVPFIDGHRSSWHMSESGADSLDLPAGHHVVSIKFESTIATLIVVAFRVYLVVWLLAGLGLVSSAFGDWSRTWRVKVDHHA